MKKTIVTGASRGIGFAIAKALVEKGATVVITGRNIETLKEAANKIGGNCFPLVWDASIPKDASNKFAEAVKILGGLDIFVSNSGAFNPRGETVIFDGGHAIR